MTKSRKIWKLLITAALILSMFGCSPEADSSMDNSSGKKNEVNSSNVTVDLSKFEEEQITRYYITDIKTEDSDVSGVLTSNLATYETVADMEIDKLDQIATFKDNVAALGEFSEVTSQIDSSAIILTGVPADDIDVSLSVSIFTDGGVQINYATQFGKSLGTDMDADAISKHISDYAGVIITADDIKSLQNKILDVAEAGAYNFVVSDAAGMNGFYITTANYGTDSEQWQVFTQRYVAPEQEDDTSSETNEEEEMSEVVTENTAVEPDVSGQ